VLEAQLLLESDLPQVLEIEAKANPTPWTAGMFLQEIKSGLSRFYLFRIERDVVGFGGYWDMVGHGHISNIAVDVRFRRRGFGREIVAFLERDMEEQGIVSATLEVRASNLVAAALYASCQFELAGRRKRYYRNGEDALIYSKNIVSR